MEEATLCLQTKCPFYSALVAYVVYNLEAIQLRISIHD